MTAGSLPDTPPEFVPFPKIPRLRRDCVITEKIDGSNGSVLVPEDDGPLLVGSRNRWITPQDDNFGFASWVRKHEDAFRALGPGHHYGEWWGSGVNRRQYGLTNGERHFSLFNTGRWNDENVLPPLRVVPVLYAGPFTTDAVEAALERLRTEGSVAAPGFMRPEGVIVYHVAARTMAKVTIERDEEPKGLAS